MESWQEGVGPLSRDSCGVEGRGSDVKHRQAQETQGSTQLNFFLFLKFSPLFSSSNLFPLPFFSLPFLTYLFIVLSIILLPPPSTGHHGNRNFGTRQTCFQILALPTGSTTWNSHLTLRSLSFFIFEVTAFYFERMWHSMNQYVH